MNYYYDFRIGLNWWMVAAIAFVAMEVLIGRIQPTRIGNKVYGRFSHAVHFFVGMVATITMTVLLFKESKAGAVQFFDNFFGSAEDPVWAVIMGMATLLVAAVMFGVVIVIVGLTVSYHEWEKLELQVILENLERIHNHNRDRNRNHNHNRQRPRRGNPQGQSRPGVQQPGRYRPRQDGRVTTYRHRTNQRGQR